MEMITTSTSARDGGESRAKVNRTRRLCLSNTLTGNRLPELRGEGGMDSDAKHYQNTDFTGSWKQLPCTCS